ncbi:MAG TPA: endolytic transglycosylase MltG, partial [Kofleriaceae bacterium]
LTLASIIEKETGKPEERPLIAAVFANRLRIGMPLQSDPTVIYGLPHFDGDLTRGDLAHPSPYNTYVVGGLPPGPIANPGLAAIDAALAPADSSALYFVSRNDGSHEFSSNLAEHNRAVGRYQRGSH